MVSATRFADATVDGVGQRLLGSWADDLHVCSPEQPGREGFDPEIFRAAAGRVDLDQSFCVALCPALFLKAFVGSTAAQAAE
jgi:hypothetical protein